jgi:hypothetical protein
MNTFNVWKRLYILSVFLLVLLITYRTFYGNFSYVEYIPSGIKDLLISINTLLGLTGDLFHSSNTLLKISLSVITAIEISFFYILFTLVTIFLIKWVLSGFKKT